MYCCISYELVFDLVFIALLAHTSIIFQIFGRKNKLLYYYLLFYKHHNATTMPKNLELTYTVHTLKTIPTYLWYWKLRNILTNLYHAKHTPHQHTPHPLVTRGHPLSPLNPQSPIFPLPNVTNTTARHTFNAFYDDDDTILMTNPSNTWSPHWKAINPTGT